MMVMKHPTRRGCVNFRLSTNLTSAGTSRCDVPARAIAGGTLAPLNAAQTVQRAVPTTLFGSCSL